MESFRLVVAGGRDFKDYPLMCKFLDSMLRAKAKTHAIVIVCGMARGADKLGEKYAYERGYQVQPHPANWEEHGKRAGYLRNEEMAKNSDATVAFWDGVSVGTKHMINITIKNGNRAVVCNY